MTPSLVVYSGLRDVKETLQSLNILVIQRIGALNDRPEQYHRAIDI